MDLKERNNGGAGAVLVTSPGFDVSDPDTAGRLRDHGLEVRYAPFGGRRSPSTLIELLDSAVAAILSGDKMTRDVLAQAVDLEVIARTGVGTDSIDLDAAKDLGIAVITTPDGNAVTVAEHALALILAVLRAVPVHDAAVKSGEWDRPGPVPLTELAGSRVGVIGYGRIGRAVVQRLRGFDAQVRVSDPYVAEADDVDLVALDELLAWCEIVTVHVPLEDSTRHLIGRREFELLMPGAVFVNTSRGSVVDEAWLLEALKSGHLRAAALDVFATEPPGDSALFDLPNVVVSPHIAGLSEQSMRRMLLTCVQGVLKHLSSAETSEQTGEEAWMSN